MQYAATTIINDVRVAIDENRIAADVDITGLPDDTLEMQDIIKSKVVDGINSVYMVAPVHMLAVTSESFNKKGAACPDSLARFVKMDCAGWKKPVYELSLPSSQMYSEFGGIKPNASRPAVVIDHGNLTLMPEPTSATIYYVKGETSQQTNYNIPVRVYRAVVYKTAALVMANYENGNLLQLLNSLCLEQLGMSSQ